MDNKNMKPTTGIAVDCGCIGNPGKAEYKGVDLETGKVIFYYRITGISTNNIAEFLAIVHGLAYAKKNNLTTEIYSDSKTAIAWTKHKKCRTTFTVTDSAQIRIIARAEEFLKEFGGKAEFWNNKQWGETPADFGRK